MSIIISSDNTKGFSTCTNLNYINTKTICTSNGLVLNSLELEPTEGPFVSKNSVH